MFGFNNSLILIVLTLTILLTLIFFRTYEYFEESQEYSDFDQISKSAEISDDERVAFSESDVVEKDKSNLIITVNNANDLRLLRVGSRFSLNVTDSLADQIVNLEVQTIDQGSNYAQITGKSDKGDTVLITYTDTLTQILLKTSYNIYEYVGDNFMGTIEQAIPLGLKNDIHDHNILSEPKQPNFTPRKLKKFN